MDSDRSIAITVAIVFVVDTRIYEVIKPTIVETPKPKDRLLNIITSLYSTIYFYVSPDEFKRNSKEIVVKRRETVYFINRINQCYRYRTVIILLFSVINISVDLLLKP